MVTLAFQEVVSSVWRLKSRSSPVRKVVMLVEGFLVGGSEEEVGKEVADLSGTSKASMVPVKVIVSKSMVWMVTLTGQVSGVPLLGTVAETWRWVERGRR